MSLRERKKIQKVLRGVSDGGDQFYKPAKPLRIAGIQCSSCEERQKNIQRALEFSAIALEKKAGIICFPEYFSLPWFLLEPPQDFLHLGENIPGESTIPFMKLSKENNIVVICPVLEVSDNKLYNTTVVIEYGEVIGIYRKIQISNVPFWEEQPQISPGNLGYKVFNTRYAKIACLLSWDNFFPEAARLLALQDVEIIFAPTSAAFQSHKRWESVLTANAVNNNIFVFRVNRVGKEEELDFYGNSFCVDPFGEFVAEPVFEKDAVVIADIDIGMVALAREEFPFLRERRRDLYQSLIDDNEKYSC